jgi:SAM-dependent methyltransferase
MEKKPIAAHTKRAFEVLVEMIDEDQKQRLLTTSSPKMFEGIVLDSGCGTGRSTKLLSNIIHPKYLVIGVDRSLARLTKTKDNRRTYEEEDNDNNNIPSASKSASESEREAYCHKVSDNAYLVRAELVDFWRCCIEHGWTTTTPSSSDNNNKLQQENYERSGGLTITHHYMLYPNPYPTKARLSSRWYAHPSFPLILKLGIPKMVVRSNWEGYLREFARAVEMANDFYVGTCSLVCKGDAGRVSMDRNLALSYLGSAKKGPSERVDKSLAYTNFESKYDSVGERTFQLILERNDTNASN